MIEFRSVIVFTSPAFMVFPKRFLYNFCFSCRYASELWKGGGARLDASYRLPITDDLDTDGKTPGSVEMRIGWNEKGLALLLQVSGKKQPVWSRRSQPEESDGLQLCIDTRDVRNVHRATRFCHRLILLPGDPMKREECAAVVWVPIHRAKGHPNPVDAGRIALHCALEPDGYRLETMIPADVLTGFEPQEHSRLGFHYVVADREIGHRHLAIGSPFPHDQDPSLWAVLELIR